MRRRIAFHRVALPFFAELAAQVPEPFGVSGLSSELAQVDDGLLTDPKHLQPILPVEWHEIRQNLMESDRPPAVPAVFVKGPYRSFHRPRRPYGVAQTDGDVSADPVGDEAAAIRREEV